MTAGNSGYLFVDRNGWPIYTEQECDLMIVDTVMDGMVSIIPGLSNIGQSPKERR